jgi:hypothetical protein
LKCPLEGKYIIITLDADYMLMFFWGGGGAKGVREKKLLPSFFLVGGRSIM